MFLAGVMTAAIVLGVTALVLRKPSSTVQPPTAPSSLPASEQPASEHDNDHDKDDRDDDDEDD
jgi:hypothetical protein